MTKVKIVKCSDNNAWYQYRIGDIFEVGETGLKDYFANVQFGGILKSDCEIVKNDTREEAHVQKREEVEKHEQNYDKAFKECIESTVTAQYVKSKPKEKVEKSCSNCKYEEVRFDAVECDTCMEQDYCDWQPKEEVEKSCSDCKYRHFNEAKSCYEDIGECNEFEKWTPIDTPKEQQEDKPIEDFILKHSKPDVKDKPKKLKLKISKPMIELLQKVLCKGCTNQLVCGICTVNLDRYVKGEK